MAEHRSLALARSRGQRWARHLGEWRQRLHDPGVVVEGKLARFAGMTLEAVGCEAALGARCLIENADRQVIEAEVVGFGDNRLFLMPTRTMNGVMPQARVIPTRSVAHAAVGHALLGRIIDGAGNPLDGRGSLRCEASRPLESAPLNPLSRQPISQPLDVGIRAINALFTPGRGQRLGLFAGSGVGKSTLLGMMTRFTQADVIVVGLIGERGREVKEFVEDNLSDEGLARSVVVATPADCSPLLRIHGAWRATAIAEHFRDQGLQVLLLMDSVTRFAQAQREIGLAVGEPPATKGYPPSVFSRLPQLIERAGTAAGRGSGSITAFYTVLAEGDDEQDPIVDAARAVLDGHIMLARDMAEAGIYPPISIEASVSRSMPRITSPQHQAAARELREIFACYMRNRDLLTVGAWQPGADPAFDRAVALWPRIQEFLRQGTDVPVSLELSVAGLEALLRNDAGAAQPVETAVPPGQ